MSKSELAVPDSKSTSLAEMEELDRLFKETARDGLANLRPEDIVLPWLSILQPTSPLSGEPGYSEGEVVNSITGEKYPLPMEFYVLHYYSNRIHWIGPDIASQTMECQSADGLTGSYKDAQHNGGICRGCPFSEWQPDPQDPSKSLRPECTEFKNIILIPVLYGVIQEGSPVVWSGKRSALKPTNQLISAMFASGKASYAYLWKMTVEKQQKEKQRWYTPRFARGEQINSVALFHKLKDMSDGISAAQARIRFQQTDEVDARSNVADEKGGF